MGKKKWTKFTERAEVADINLTPMIDMFVALIPFLLISAAFLRLSGFHMDIPSASTKADMHDKKLDKIVNLSFEVKPGEVHVEGFSDQFTTPIRGLVRTFKFQNDEDLQQLSAWLDSLKSKYEIFENAIFHASPSTSYEQAIQVLDAVHMVPDVTRNVVLATGVVD